MKSDYRRHFICASPVAVFRQPDFFVQPGMTLYRPPPQNLTVIYLLWGIMLIAWCAFLLFTRRRLKLVISLPAGEGATV